MSKEAKFFITDFRDYHKFVNEPVRHKEDIIRILLLTLKILLIEEKFEDEDKGEVNVIVDKTSRIYFVCKEPEELPSKYYSFVFPFFLEQINATQWSVKCKISSEVISTELIDYLLVLLNKGWFSDNNINSDGIDKFACDYLDEFEEYYKLTNIIKDETNTFDVTHWSIIKNLLTFEPSYIRYDHDPKHQNGDIHPLDHLDVHYTTSGTFKLGLDNTLSVKNRLDLKTFKDILENGKSRGDLCYKLK